MECACCNLLYDLTLLLYDVSSYLFKPGPVAWDNGTKRVATSDTCSPLCPVRAAAFSRIARHHIRREYR